MKKIELLLVVLGFMLLNSCTSKKTIKPIPVITIVEKGELIFSLDDSTIENMEYLQYFQRNDSNIFAFTNRYDNSIVFYDYDTRKYIDRICYHKEGGDGIGSIFSFYYINEDSVYLYHFNFRTLYHTNSKGRVLKKHQINVFPNPSPDSLFLAPILFPRTLSPLRLVNDEMLIPGFLMAEVKGENEENRPVMTYYDLKTGGIRHSDSYPAIYHKGYWGGDFIWRNPYYTLSPKNEIVLSFSADHNIRVHEFSNTKYKECYAGNGDDTEFEPIESYIPIDARISEEQCHRHYVENLNYGPILYDNYRKIYYRIVLLPDYDIDIKKKPIRKPVGIIVLNEEFEIIGKCSLPKADYWINQCFVGVEGLHIQIQSDNEDELKFKTFMIDKFNGI